MTEKKSVKKQTLEDMYKELLERTEPEEDSYQHNSYSLEQPTPLKIINTQASDHAQMLSRSDNHE